MEVKEVADFIPKTDFGKEMKKIVDNGDVTHAHIYHLIQTIEILEIENKASDELIDEKQITINHLLEKIEERKNRVGMLEKMLSDTLNDIQIIRDNNNRTHSSLESAIRNYFERVKEVNSIYTK